jgi:hypothetical protein
VQALVTSLKEASDDKIKAALNLQLNRNRASLMSWLASSMACSKLQTPDADEQDDLDADEEEDATAPRTVRAAALNAYMQAVRAQARAAASSAQSASHLATAKSSSGWQIVA